MSSGGACSPVQDVHRHEWVHGVWARRSGHGAEAEAPAARRPVPPCVFDYEISLCTVVLAPTADSSAAVPATSAAAAAKGSALVPPPSVAPAIVVAAVYGRQGWAESNSPPMSC